MKTALQTENTIVLDRGRDYTLSGTHWFHIFYSEIELKPFLYQILSHVSALASSPPRPEFQRLAGILVSFVFEVWACTSMKS